MKTEIVIDNIDFKLLREQKLALLNIEADKLTTKEANAIDGIITLIDYIQDYAVDNLGMDKKDVYIISDYLEYPELIPADVQAAIDTFDGDADPYHECARILEEVAKRGWTFDYDLGGEIFELQPIYSNQ